LSCSYVAYLVACTKTTPPPAPSASFTITLFSGGEVRFTNNSQNALTYTWDFGDNTANVTDASPSHVYALNGKYNVVLTATGDGGTASSTQVVTVTNVPDPKPTANFTFSEAAGVVSFTSATSYATAVDWEFGDGTPNSSEANPKHTYTKNQPYTVKLTATGKGGTVTASKLVEVKTVPIRDPATITITNVFITDIEPIKVGSGSTFTMSIQRGGNSSGSASSSATRIWKSDKFTSPLKAATRYDLTNSTLPLLVRLPSEAHYFFLTNDKTFVIPVEVKVDNLLTALKNAGYPLKATVTCTSCNVSFELSLTYTY
jgi:PKD repeat protein